MEAMDLVMKNEYILPQILSHLRMRDIENCRLVSRGWNVAVDTMVKNVASLKRQLNRELNKQDWFDRKEVKIVELKNSFQVNGEILEDVVYADNETNDSQFIFATMTVNKGLPENTEYLQEYSWYLVKFDLETGQFIEILRILNCFDYYPYGRMEVCGDFVIIHIQKDKYNHLEYGGKWFLINKFNIKDNNGSNIRYQKTLDEHLKDTCGTEERGSIVLQHNNDGVWSLKDIGNILEIYLLSDIKKGFELKGKINFDTGEGQNWKLENFAGVIYGIVVELDDDERGVKQYIFITLPNVEVTSRKFFDLPTEMTCDTFENIYLWNENTVVFKTYENVDGNQFRDEHISILNTTGQEMSKFKITNRVTPEEEYYSRISKYYIFDTKEFDLIDTAHFDIVQSNLTITNAHLGTTKAIAIEHGIRTGHIIGSTLIFKKMNASDGYQFMVKNLEIDDQPERPLHLDRNIDPYYMRELRCEGTMTPKFIGADRNDGRKRFLISSPIKRYMLQ